MDQYAAPDTAPTRREPSLSIAPVVLTTSCITLGVLGTLAVCSTTLMTTWSYAAPAFMDASQAQAMESVRATQGWWVLPATVVQLIGKLALSLGLIGGGVAVMMRVRGASRVFRPVLFFGIALELVLHLFSTLYTLVSFKQMGRDYGDIMSADPAIAPEVGQTMGEVFGWVMLAGMGLMLLWGVAKAALYAATAWSLRSNEA